jgi:N6-adenosine-specific RNA methylase IME4
MPMLPSAFKVIEAWGFTYKTVGFTWVKRNRYKDSWFWGMGNWTRANAEVCLLAIRGKPKRVSASVHSVVDSAIRSHSQKPYEVREKIVELMGDLPRIELFARDVGLGWDAWGLEV